MSVSTGKNDGALTALKNLPEPFATMKSHEKFLDEILNRSRCRIFSLDVAAIFLKSSPEMNRLTGHHISFQPIDALAAPSTLEITVYRRVHRTDVEENGQPCEVSWDEPTPLRLNNACIVRILAIPNLRSIHVFDSPAYCGPLAFYSCPGPKQHPENFWFVHYRDHDELRFGAGAVLILHRETGEAVYRGSDGGE